MTNSFQTKNRAWFVRRSVRVTWLQRSIFLGALSGGELIGFIKLTDDDTRIQSGIMNIVGMIQHRDKAPTNALLAGCVRSCADRQIPNLVYANFAYGNKQHDSLQDFKQNNGFQRVDVPRYYVPLTMVGSMAFRLGLHKKFADRVPEPVLARLRQMRNAWYSRRLQSAVEVS